MEVDLLLQRMGENHKGKADEAKTGGQAGSHRTHFSCSATRSSLGLRSFGCRYDLIVYRELTIGALCDALATLLKRAKKPAALATDAAPVVMDLAQLCGRCARFVAEQTDTGAEEGSTADGRLAYAHGELPATASASPQLGLGLAGGIGERRPRGGGAATRNSFQQTTPSKTSV